MADILSKGSLFPEELIPGLVQKTVGASALAKLCAATPIPFAGTKEFTFTMDKEVNILAENGAYTKGGVTVSPVTIQPFKVEYSARVSDEFMYASEDVQLDILTGFSEGFARKVARGIDLMAIHGINPRTATASTVIGDNCFDKQIDADNIITIASTDTPDGNIEAAVGLVQAADKDVTGMVLAPAFRSLLAAQLTTGGAKLYPELSWGNNPGKINGLQVEVNSTLSANSSLDRALVGNFADFFRWGYAKEIPIEVIPYGNPDNDETLGDLKGHGQVLLRGQVYLGFGILDKTAFALVKASS